MARILIIEDEKNLARFIELELKYEGYETKVCSDGRTGLNTAVTEEWDAVLLDLMLPELSGIEVCRRIRQTKPLLPVVMVTARDDVLDRVSGLDSGADDYIVKPFAIEELLARLRSLFRRMDQLSHSELTVLTFKDLSVELESCIVKKGDRVLNLTKREYDLLVVFISNINIVLTREVLLDKVWGYNTGVETNVVDVYVRYLRNKIDDDSEQSYIQTVRGTGYVMR
ncbi:response regulator transcription factor [Neobacillus terrae]|uniref:response regulator transcription factor n=1 Tax=Neobacillus terrae TaxID=3034837 RepID=UPI00140C541F|nr:response regulator transcription factor [Neobacillus terrae]NHM29390.1 response regulator transcription factor [Neobacillus terrae]